MIRGSVAFLLCLAFAPAVLADPPPHSESIAIKGTVDHPRTVTVADLQHETQATVTVSMHTGHGTLAGVFTGVPLWMLIQEAGITAPEGGKKNDIIRHMVTVTGTDGYSAVLSLGEIAPEFSNDQAIIAIQQDGKPIEGGNGFARLIIPSDKAAGRAVSAIATIEVK